MLSIYGSLLHLLSTGQLEHKKTGHLARLFFLPAKAYSLRPRFFSIGSICGSCPRHWR